MKDFHQLQWDDQLADDCRQLVRLAVREDLERLYDWTTVALVPETARSSAAIVARQAGVIAGLPAAQLALDEMDIAVEWEASCRDGDHVEPGQTVTTLTGPARDLLTAERLLLNLLGHLSGVATLTGRYVRAIEGTAARIYDTRKTTPGWRRLEKYAVRCGGGFNHRTGLFDAVLIKDNHLAVAATLAVGQVYQPAEAVTAARTFLEQTAAESPRLAHMIVEVEVDTLEQLASVLTVAPDIVLLDNMTPEQLRQAVALRDRSGSSAQLEASGGITLQSIRAVAETGVERISVGAITHSAVSLDLSLDWR